MKEHAATFAMPGNRLQLTRTLVETTNRAEVQRVAKPAFRLDVASDAQKDAVDACVAFFQKHEQEATLKTSPKSSRFIESGINLVFEDSVAMHFPASTTKTTVSRRLASFLLFDPVRPMLHQRVAVKEWTEKEPQTYMLNFSMGAGKTLCTILMLSAMKPAPRRILIVCSNTLIGHWIKEIGRTAQLEGETTFCIQGYTDFRKTIGHERNHFIRKYDVVVVDEAHYYRNLTPSMCGDVAALRDAKRLILLTGTVLQNDKEERHGMLYLMGLRGDESLAEAEKKLSGVLFYYNPAEHGNSFTQSAYPKLVVHVERVPMAPAQTLEYLMSESKHTKIGPYTISTARCNSYNSLTRAISNTMSSGDMSPKFERVIENITSGKYPGPHVVYSHYRPKGVETVERELKKHQKEKGAAFRTVLMTGSTPARERDEMIARFNRKEIDVFFITDAAREGIDLHGTGTMHLIEPHENVHSERQTQSRVARHNSHVALPTSERQVIIVKYVSTFPALRASDKKELDAYFERTYSLQSAQTFDIVKELDRMMKQAVETVDEQYERTNVEKARELQPWIDMLHRVGFRKEAVGVNPPPPPPAAVSHLPSSAQRSLSSFTTSSSALLETPKKLVPFVSKTTQATPSITDAMKQIVKIAQRRSAEAMTVRPLSALTKTQPLEKSKNDITVKANKAATAKEKVIETCVEQYIVEQSIPKSEKAGRKRVAEEEQRGKDKGEEREKKRARRVSFSIENEVLCDAREQNTSEKPRDNTENAKKRRFADEGTEKTLPDSKKLKTDNFDKKVAEGAQKATEGGTSAQKAKTGIDCKKAAKDAPTSFRMQTRRSSVERLRV